VAAGGLIGHSLDAEERARIRTQAPQTYARLDQGQPPGVADVKAMARAGIRDDGIISLIRNTGATYHLGAGDINDLQNSRVSQKVIDFMANTPGLAEAAPAPPLPMDKVIVAGAPPPPRLETIVVAPSPAHVWIPGEWAWQGRWVWASGRWTLPPYPQAVWIRGVWVHGPGGWRHRPGHWR